MKAQPGDSAPKEDHITKTARFLYLGVPRDEILEWMKVEGLDEYNSWLCLKAAKLLEFF